MMIEANTQELQEILQAVYNLPNAGSGGGSAKADLVITGISRADTNTGGYFGWDQITNNGGESDPKYVTFDQEEVISTYEKLIAGDDVRAVLKLPAVPLNSWDPYFSTVFPAIRVAAARENTPARLLVRFECASVYNTNKGTYVTVEYVFVVDTVGRTAFLDNRLTWHD